MIISTSKDNSVRNISNIVYLIDAGRYKEFDRTALVDMTQNCLDDFYNWGKSYAPGELNMVISDIHKLKDYVQSRFPEVKIPDISNTSLWSEKKPVVTVDQVSRDDGWER